MIKNYFKIAFRTLFKNRTYSAINITGLAVSLTASVLLLLWVWDELSYDRMHSKADRIYIAAAAIGKSKDQIWPVTNAPLAIFGKAEIPAIEDACRTSTFNGDILLEYGDKKFNESRVYVDGNFFQIFDFKLLEGDPAKPFPDNRSIVLDKTTAEKYFGKEPAIGKVLQVKDGNSYKVTGVMEDMPKNSDWQFPLILPFDILAENRPNNPLNADWGNLNYQTFFLLKPGADAAAVGRQLADIHRKNQQADFWKDLNYLMQPLTKYHLYSADGDEQGMKQVKIFALVAVVILLIACINYVNLVTARSTRRSKEVSVRKVVGANKGHLFWQFISESFVVFIISMLIAIGLLFALMPLYNSLSGKEMVFSLFDGKVWAIFGLALLAVLALAGVYPALMLSSFNPALALKGIIPGLGKNSGFRKALVIIQFTCSVVLIVSTIIISRQLEYIRSMDLGYSKDNTFTFNSYNFRKNYENISRQLEQQPGILGVTTSSQRILNVQSSTGDLEWEGKPADMSNFMINQLSVDRTFPEVMDMQLIAGKGFTGTAADSSYYLLNETAIKVMGLEDPVGKPVTFHDNPGIIAGIVKDFHFKDMKTAIEPCILFMDPSWGWNTMYVKTTGKDAKIALAAVEKIWKQYNADYEFNYNFMDESFDNMYKSDIRSGKLFNIFAGVAILLSCLGLFGLVTFTAETKFKEIGIRKTLGASVGNIILLISKDFLKLVGISFVVAFPLGWWMMNKWLDNYAYRTSIEWWVFGIAGLTAFAIAAITVCGKSLKAAQENPIKAIRTE
ncbi:ABC transporter permease [Olivibacter sitiensis]|uniref:ABC transporter permease n=1 Tax=Olivibacter sitiensis TaxID=376470 RepID=UPI000427647D|nr:ABC transporter permease [Olivibacter sitiensis]